MKEKMNIMFVANKKYIQPMITFLYSLFIHQENEVDLYLFYSDIEDVSLKRIQEFCNHWEGKSLIPIKMDLSKIQNLYVTDKLPLELYYKLLCVDFLPQNLSRILCLDLDIAINKSLDALYNTDIEGHPLAACADIYAYIFGEGVKNHERLKIDEKYQYFNGGMLLLNLDYLRAFGGGTPLIEYAFLNKRNLKWLEQDVMNHFFVDKYLPLNWYDYNCVPVMYIMKIEDVEQGKLEPLYRDEIQKMDSFDGYADYTQAICDNATIIHYIGESKPWDSDRPEANTYKIFDKFYYEYFSKAQEIFNNI